MNASQRRHVLLGGLATTVATLAQAQTPQAGVTTTPTTDTIPLVLPRTEFVYEAIADLEPSITLGSSPFGDRFMVPIVDGSFEGINGLRGKVMAGGADRQLLRRDGAKALDAIYELQTHDGAVISIRNRVLTRPLKDKPGRYAFSTLDITAPDGPYGWLNDYVYVGTLDSLRPKRNAVVIRVYRVV